MFRVQEPLLFPAVCSRYAIIGYNRYHRGVGMPAPIDYKDPRYAQSAGELLGS